MDAPYPAADRTTTLRMVRLFKASRDRLFAAWTDSRQMAAWFGPPDVSVRSCELDVRVGGSWRLSGGRNGQPLLAVSGKYLEVTPPERLVFTWAWRQQDGSRGHETEVTITFEPAGKNTKLTLVQTLFAEELHRDNHSKGWESSFNSLEKYLASA